MKPDYSDALRWSQIIYTYILARLEQAGSSLEGKDLHPLYVFYAYIETRECYMYVCIQHLLRNNI